MPEGVAATAIAPHNNLRGYCRAIWWRRRLAVVVAALVTASAASAGPLPYTLHHTFDDPTITTFDVFGISLALDGNNVLIGASGDSTNGTEVGQAHLFDLSGNLLHTFDDPTATFGDSFGTSLALKGSRVLIGAPFDSTNGSSVGQAHLFDLNGNLLHTFDDPTVTGSDFFGRSVTFDGNNVLIGAPGDDTNGSSVGQAHLFDLSGTLLHTFDDPTVTSFDSFGSSVALEGNNVLISATSDDTNGNNVGQAHLFELNGNLLQTFDDPTPTADGRFGNSVDLDGNNVLVGAFLDNTNGDNVGQAYLFDLSGNLLQTFDDPTITMLDRFGKSVALDGNKVLIGARLDDTNGDNVGQAHLFDLSGNLLHTFDDPTVTGGDSFGTSVALNSNSVLIGATFDSTNGLGVGQAYLFTPEPSTLVATTIIGTTLMMRRRRAG